LSARSGTGKSGVRERRQRAWPAGVARGQNCAGKRGAQAAERHAGEAWGCAGERAERHHARLSTGKRNRGAQHGARAALWPFFVLFF
jgi:hypothetical protein